MRLPEGYETYRLMRMFPGLTLDQVGELPAEFVTWAFEFDRIEGEAKAELEKEAQRKAG